MLAVQRTEGEEREEGKCLMQACKEKLLFPSLLLARLCRAVTLQQLSPPPALCSRADVPAGAGACCCLCTAAAADGRDSVGNQGSPVLDRGCGCGMVPS